MKKIWFAAVPFAAFATAGTAQAHDGDHMYGGDWGWSWGHMAFGSLFLITLIVIAVVVVVAVLRWVGGGGSATIGGRSRALDILEERFARGEIDREEFLEKKQDLE